MPDLINNVDDFNEAKKIANDIHCCESFIFDLNEVYEKIVKENEDDKISLCYKDNSIKVSKGESLSIIRQIIHNEKDKLLTLTEKLNRLLCSK